MKRHFAPIATSFLLLASLASAAPLPPVSPFGLHLDLEMTGAEYATILEKLESSRAMTFQASDPLRAILDQGKRNLDWLARINAARPADRQLELSTPESTVGIPITQPRFSNRTIIQARRDELIQTLPAAIVEVVFRGGALTDQAPVADDEFLAAIRAIDSLYQAASRWLLQEPYLFQYAARAQQDVRGYYFLSREADLEAKLRDLPNLPTADQSRLTELLVIQCRNSGGSKQNCATELTRSKSRAGGAWAFHQKYRSAAKSLYDSFFAVVNPRREAVWTAAHPNELVFPFLQPKDGAVESWLRDNLEDEWMFGPWRLSLSFRASGPNLAHVVFVPGATPNVNGLGGSRITMDANRDIQEYLVRWTIRHEFGHVLGFPDCYIEYYDETARAMVNYQIDVDNLMCSRRGHLQQTHYDEMKKNYYRP